MSARGDRFFILLVYDCALILLQRRYSPHLRLVSSPAAESDKIPGIDRAVSGGDTVTVGSHSSVVLDTPGHTLGHVSFHFEEAKLAFVGDVLFSLGCGRIF